MNPLKFLAALLLAALTTAAHAASFEAGIGASQFDTSGNTVWYQQGFPYSLSLRSHALMLGVTGDLTPRVAWHVDYVNLGGVHTDAIATPVDSNYNPATQSCNGPCVAQSRFVGNGADQGFTATLEPHIDWRGWRFGAEAGVFLSLPTWEVTVYNWKLDPSQPSQTITASHRVHWQRGPVIGVSIARGAWGLQIRRYFDATTGDTPASYGDPVRHVPAIWQHTTTVMLTYKTGRPGRAGPACLG